MKNSEPKFCGKTFVPAEGLSIWEKYGEDIGQAAVMTVIVGVLSIGDHFHKFKGFNINSGKTSEPAKTNTGLGSAEGGAPGIL